ncbi:MAG: methyltransferase domain-containing protein [Oscillospiraceae bacterium]|nr:methyltransferase domain-containing protein [Oscillospiraceae bacterium]
MQIKFEPDNFQLENNTVWSFPERGNWATHDAKYRGNWSPYIPRNLLLRYSQEGDLVLDQFAGGGTTLVEAKLLNRNIIGVDISPTALDRCRIKTAFDYSRTAQIYIKQGDARNLDFIQSKSVDLICTHPPYADIIHYSDGIDGDLSNYSVRDFLEQMKSVVAECFRVLRYGKFCAILMGDTRKKGCVVPMSFDVMKIFENAGFTTKEIIIKEQHNCKTLSIGKQKAS